ncbi:heparan-alpha-glucosaminide N-acetyltransferase [Primorskyibacter sp. 2E233]|uniref:heparan-alpha-glucosaminide N-acetyltransferase n=1 Tax=Primorskyibacter sp. 2E233 TaxID=3413431 RepID=UPI003BF20994
MLDIARTVALLGMILFHFVKDMEVFGLIASGTTLTGGWAIFARCIAGSFIFISGVSFVLAHSRGFDGKAWRRRFILIAGAACLVTLATYAVFPSRFIYFGILHAIAAASFLGLPFLFAPAWLALLGAAVIISIFATVGGSLFPSPLMAWTGLSTAARASLDFLPVVPWFAAFLLGIAFAKVAPMDRLEPTWPKSFPARALAWPGQHSLVVYLLHQPLLMAIIWMATQVML